MREGTSVAVAPVEPPGRVARRLLARRVGRRDLPVEGVRVEPHPQVRRVGREAEGRAQHRGLDRDARGPGATTSTGRATTRRASSRAAVGRLLRDRRRLLPDGHVDRLPAASPRCGRAARTRRCRSPPLPGTTTMSFFVTRSRAGTGGSSRSPATRSTRAFTRAWRTVKPMSHLARRRDPEAAEDPAAEAAGLERLVDRALRSGAGRRGSTRATLTGRSGASSRTITTGCAMSCRAR